MSLLQPLQPKPSRPSAPLIGSYIPAGAIVSLTGPNASFKSVVAQTLAVRCCTGGYVGDTQLSPGRGVVYMSAQAGKASGRLNDLLDGQSASIHLCRPVDLTTPQGFINELQGLTESNGPLDLLIIDGLTGTTGKLRLNFDGEAYSYVEALRALLPYFRGILLVDTAAPSGGLRGSQALRDGVDIDLRINRFRNARERATTPDKAAATLVCHSTTFARSPRPIEVALSAKSLDVTLLPTQLTTEDIDSQSPDFLEDVQRYELDHLLRATRGMTPVKVLNMGRLRRAEDGENGEPRYLQGNLLTRINERVARHLHIPVDSMSQPEYLKRCLAHHRDRLIHNPIHAGELSTNFNEETNDDF